jgi:protein O-GlcNAc transferase
MQSFREACDLLAQRRWSEALAAFDGVLAEAPDLHQAHNNRGVALHNLHRDEDALAAYAAALQLAPRYASAWCNRGNALTTLRRYGEALDAYAAALRQDASMRAALDNRGALLMTLNRPEDAARDFEQLLSIAPDHPFARGNLLLARRQTCDWRDHETLRNDVIAGLHARRPALPPFAGLAVLDDPMDQARCAEDWASRFFPPADPIVRKPRPWGERVRLGYLSADFHAHATAYLAVEMFERHDRARFETVGFSYGPPKQDSMRTRLESAFDRFVDVSTLSDRAIAEAMAEAEIDIAIDLKGYTLDGRPGILAHRGAPVQASFLGFPGGLGAPYVDYVIADAVVAPPEHQPFYAEKIVRLPHTYQPNSARAAAAPPTRVALGLPKNAFVFCSFNNAFKLTQDTFAIWMRLLRAAEGSVLWLHADAATARNLRNASEAAGINQTRLIFAAHASQDEHIARLTRADLFLDTLPYNAHTTASDALWAGLPVLTLRGETFAGRVAASLLTAAGAPELITASAAEYEALALDLARNPARLAAISARLTASRESTPLFDIARFTRALESAYLTMAERAAAGLPPQAFDVAAG